MADTGRKEKDLPLVENFETVRAITADGRSVHVPKSKFGGNLEIAKEDVLGGIKASPRGETDTQEVKIDPNTGRLYCPPSEMSIATSEKLGGIVADAKTAEETEEVKIDPSTGKLYVHKSEGNPPDEEDITLVEIDGENKLQFNDKSYDRSSYSGLGRTYLRKNIVNGVNALDKNMILKANTRYIIQYDYDLQGKTVTVPDGCVLDFQGGSLNNGKVVFGTTLLEGCPLLNVRVEGVFKNSEIKMEWFLNDFETALQDVINCAEAAAIPEGSAWGAIYGATFQSIILESRKVYTVNKTISFGNYLNIRGNRATIAKSSSGSLLYSNKGMKVDISDLVFVGRDVTAVHIENPNIDSSSIRLRKIEFITDNIEFGDTNYAVYIKAQSAQTFIEKCFVKSAPKFLYTSGDFCYLNNCWINGYSQYANYARPENTCCIVNKNRLFINNSVFIPEIDAGTMNPNSRWIDNYTTLTINNSHFGAENGGYPIVWQFKNLFDDTWDTNYIAIENTQCAGGGSLRPESGIVVLMNNIAPGKIRLKNLRYTKNTPTISLYGYIKDEELGDGETIKTRYPNPTPVYDAASQLFREYVESVVSKTTNETCYLVPSKIDIDDTVMPLDQALSVYQYTKYPNIFISKNVSAGSITIADLYRKGLNDTGAFEKRFRVMLSGTYYQSPWIFSIAKTIKVTVINEYANSPTVIVTEEDVSISKSDEGIVTEGIDITMSCDIKSWIRQELKLNITAPSANVSRLAVGYTILDEVQAFRGATRNGGYLFFRPAIVRL